MCLKVNITSSNSPPTICNLTHNQYVEYHNSTTNHHHHKHHNHSHDSSKKKMRETPHKLHDTPPYSDIFFAGNGFERYSEQPKANVSFMNNYFRKQK